MAGTPTPNPKYDTHARTDNISSYPQIRSITDGGGGGTESYSLPDGTEVTTQEQSSYSNVIEERKKLLAESAVLTEEQQKELDKNNTPKQIINVAIDTAAVQQYNEYMASQGYNNAADYVNAVRNQNNEQPPSVRPELISENNYHPSRTINPGESQEPIHETGFKEPFVPNTQSQMNAASSVVKQDSRGWAVQAQEYMALQQTKFEMETNKPIIEMMQNPSSPPIPIMLAERYAYGFAAGLIGLGQYGWEVIKNPNPAKIIQDTGEGMVAFSEEVVNNVVSGDIPALTQNIGEVQGQALLLKLPGELKAKWSENINLAETQMKIQEKQSWLADTKPEGQSGTYQAVKVYIDPKESRTAQLYNKILEEKTKEVTARESQIETQAWLDKNSAPVENPMFNTQWERVGLEDATQKTVKDVPKEFSYIPTEQTQLGKEMVREVQKETGITKLDASSGELLPGTYLEASQPSNWLSEQYYKELGNKPSELQLRLSIQKREGSSLPFRTPEEILEMQKISKQIKLMAEETTAKTDFFQSPEQRAKDIIREVENKAKQEEWYKDAKNQEKMLDNVNTVEFNKRLMEAEAKQAAKEAAAAKLTEDSSNSPILATQPIVAAGMVIVEQIPRVTDYLKDKYAIYKKGLKEETTIREGGIVIRQAETSNVRNPALTPIAIIRIQNPTKQGISPSYVELVRYAINTEQAQAPVQKTFSIIDQRQKQGQGQGLSQRQRQAQGLEQGQVIIQSQAQVQEQAQSQAQVQVQAQAQIQKQLTKQNTKQNIIQEQTPEPNKPKPKVLFGNTKEERKQELVTIKVRRKGIFETVGTETNTMKAQAKAQMIVENTAAASFKLEKQGRALSDLQIGSEFSPSKKEKGVYIQKNKFRINTPGEKSEITAKGIFANKQNNKKTRRKTQWEF
jgi:hypothetical protein